MKINRNSLWIDGQDFEWRMVVIVFTCDEASTATKHSWMTWLLTVIYIYTQHAICHGRMFNHTVFPLARFSPTKMPIKTHIYILSPSHSWQAPAVYDHCVLEKQVGKSHNCYMCTFWKRHVKLLVVMPPKYYCDVEQNVGEWITWFEFIINVKKVIGIKESS